MHLRPGDTVVQNGTRHAWHNRGTVPARLAVFFPGLLFGWIRAWRGGMGAAMAVHAASNIWSEILLSGWKP